MQRIRKGDTVQVVAGDERDSRGTVHRVVPGQNRVVVEGINIVKKHQKPRPPARQAGIIEVEAPVHLSNVLPVCVRCDTGVRVGFRTLEDGSKVRYCKKCGENLV